MLTSVNLDKLSVPFQPRTGWPGHLAHATRNRNHHRLSVSTPDGLARPFSLGNIRCSDGYTCKFQTRTGWPGHLASYSSTETGTSCEVSNPNGLARPFSPNASSG